MKIRLIVPCLALVALVALPAVALAGTPGGPKLKGAKSEDGPYKNDVIPVTVESPRNLYVKVISRAEKPQSVTLHENACCEEKDYTFKWFKNDLDISQDVQTSGYEFTLKPDKPRIFRARVKPDVPDPDQVCLYPDLDAGAGSIYGPYFAINHPSACI